MDPTSTAARASAQRVTFRSSAVPAPVREYRRDRNHLYPLEEFQKTVTDGVVVSSFCGLEISLPRGGGSGVVEATGPVARDCVTCVDIWCGSSLVSCERAPQPCPLL